MKEYLNAKCSICGIRYHICGSCTNTKSFTPWRTIACSANCYKIFMALSAYTNGLATKEETRDILKATDLTYFEMFEDNIRTSIRNILTEASDTETR